MPRYLTGSWLSDRTWTNRSLRESLLPAVGERLIAQKRRPIKEIVLLGSNCWQACRRDGICSVCLSRNPTRIRERPPCWVDHQFCRDLDRCMPGTTRWPSELFSIRVLILAARRRAINIRAASAALILGGLVSIVSSSSPSLAQSKDTGVLSAPRNAGKSAPGSATPNTNTNPHKHRYWRHRGGTHPHFGSRRVRT